MMIPSILMVYVVRGCSCVNETARMIFFPRNLIVPLMTRALLVNILIRGSMSIFLERLSLRPFLTVVLLLKNIKNSVLTIEISIYLILFSLSLFMRVQCWLDVGVFLVIIINK